MKIYWLACLKLCLADSHLYFTPSPQSIVAYLCYCVVSCTWTVEKVGIYEV